MNAAMGGFPKRARAASFEIFGEHSYGSEGGMSPGVISRERSDALSVTSGGGTAGHTDDENTVRRIRHAERMKIALQNMSEEQKDRFEHFTRSHFDRESVRRAMVEALTAVRANSGNGYVGESRSSGVVPGKPPDVDEHMVIVMGALAKMFVGDVVHAARVAMDERGDEGPVQPRHAREALRRLQRDRKIPVLRSAAQVDR